MADKDNLTLVVVAVLVFVGVVFLFFKLGKRTNPRLDRTIYGRPMYQQQNDDVERYGGEPVNYERVEKVLGRLENNFHLTGVPQSQNIPEMAVGLGVGPGILGNMRNPTEGIYLSPNTGVF